MKNKLLIGILAIGVTAFSACNGDHSTRVARDTVGNRYNVDTAKVERSNMDTAKIISPDNSASGGITALKDSSKE